MTWLPLDRRVPSELDTARKLDEPIREHGLTPFHYDTAGALVLEVGS